MTSKQAMIKTINQAVTQQLRLVQKNVASAERNRCRVKLNQVRKAKAKPKPSPKLRSLGVMGKSHSVPAKMKIKRQKPVYVPKVKVVKPKLKLKSLGKFGF